MREMCTHANQGIEGLATRMGETGRILAKRSPASNASIGCVLVGVMHADFRRSTLQAIYPHVVSDAVVAPAVPATAFDPSMREVGRIQYRTISKGYHTHAKQPKNEERPAAISEIPTKKITAQKIMTTAKGQLVEVCRTEARVKAAMPVTKL